MTPKQTSLYWREWQTAKIAGHLEEEDRRHLTREALGEDKSSKDFTNEDFDKVLAAFRAISQPDSLDAQLRAFAQPRQRLLHGIKRACAPEYRDAIARDKFGTGDLDLLGLAALRQLLITLKSRSKRHSQNRNAVSEISPGLDAVAAYPGSEAKNDLNPVGVSEMKEPF